MFNHISLRTFSLLVSGIIGLAGVSLAILLGYTIQNVRSIEANWYEYQIVRSEKALHESVLRASIGYGGMIHEFKNYVLRHEDFRMDRVQANIGAAKAAIHQYQSLRLSEAEKSSLQDINGVLINYSQALLTTRELIGQNVSAKEIDEQVKVDDSIALRSLDILKNEVLRLSGAADEQRKVKGRIAANIRAGMGYGGMIHEFKNLVLRGDLPRIKKVQAHIDDIRNNIETYRTLGTTTAEKIALDDIENTVVDYESKLDLFSNLTSARSSVSQIDQAVKVDDTNALRGLKTLDREIAFQIELLSREVEDKLSFLANVVPMANWGVLASIVLAMGLSVWFFQVYVIRPISTVVSVMNVMAKDNTDVVITGLGRRNEIGQMARALETFRDNIFNRKAAEEEIRHMALTDPLTGLANRKRFKDRLAEAIKMAKRTNTSIACMMIDLDNFKPINDTYGHAAGDEVLRVVGERLTHLSRETDVVARLGGDEFSVIATTIEDSYNAEIPAKRILDQLNLPIYFEGNNLNISGSIGVSIFPQDTDNADKLLRLADEALYAAKNAGRNTYCFAVSDQSEQPPVKVLKLAAQ